MNSLAARIQVDFGGLLTGRRSGAEGFEPNGGSNRSRPRRDESDNPSNPEPLTVPWLMDRFEARLRTAEPGIRELIARVPLLPTPPFPAEWLRCEMLERLDVLRRAPLEHARTVLEVGSGAHAISTIPLAHLVGPEGRVVAGERSRWGKFLAIVAGSGLGNRIHPVACDALRLPLCDNSADLAVCVHGLRSLQGEERSVRVVREMLRAAPRVFLAESLPIARTNAQSAHLAMYNLREDAFLAASGTTDDLRYAPLERIVSLAERAGGSVEVTETLQVDLPHFLAGFPRTLVEGVRPGDLRERLLQRWDEADRMRRRYGEDHPPVGIVIARRR